jgi:hypothetical protein
MSMLSAEPATQPSVAHNHHHLLLDLGALGDLGWMS